MDNLAQNQKQRTDKAFALCGVVKVERSVTTVCPKCGGSPIEHVNINKHCPYCDHYW